MKHISLFFLIVSIGTLQAQDFWEQTNGPLGENVFSLAINSDGHIFAGTDSSIFRSTDNGDSWTETITALTDMGINSLAINSVGDIFAGLGVIIRSMDNGDNWSFLPASAGNFAIVINPSGDIFAGNHGQGGILVCSVLRSTDNGDSWSEACTGIQQDDIWSLAVNSGGDLFAGTDGSGVFRSTDNGDTWTEINNGLTVSYVRSLTINSTGHIFAGIFGAGVFRSTDNGDTWTEINNGLTNPLVHIFRSLAINSTGHIFAGTDGGPLRSTDNGDTWTEINNGLTNLVVYSLAINSSGHIFAGTGGGGVFRSLQSTTSVREVTGELPSSFSLAQNYPNPFNPSSTIEYTLLQSGEVSLIVYNLLGHEVANLVNGEMEAGYHKVTWNASNFASGIYLYRLQAGDFVQTRKMVLLK